MYAYSLELTLILHCFYCWNCTVSQVISSEDMIRLTLPEVAACSARMLCHRLRCQIAQPMYLPFFHAVWPVWFKNELIPVRKLLSGWLKPNCLGPFIFTADSGWHLFFRKQIHQFQEYEWTKPWDFPFISMSLIAIWGDQNYPASPLFTHEDCTSCQKLIQ